jgi:hypothetical protein
MAFAAGLLLGGGALAQPTLDMPKAAAGGDLAPANPQVVLYDQMNDPASNVTSQDFETANDSFDNQAADDFTVTAPGWRITSVEVDGQFNVGGPAEGFNVRFYADAGALPGTLVAERLVQPYTGGTGVVDITLAAPVDLAPGPYWVSVQARMDFTPFGQWYWTTRNTVAGDAAAWRNPGGGFGTGCADWNTRTTCIPTIAGPDQLFRLNGDLLPSGPAAGRLLVVAGETIGYAPNNYTVEASNIVNYTYDNSLPATNDFALFETHDPWGATIVKDAITGAGHAYTIFTPADLATVNFADYRVVVLNWDDNDISVFLADYVAALGNLEAYVEAGGVLWVQGSIQHNGGTSFPLPFGGTADAQFDDFNYVVDTSHPMMAGVPNPLPGSFASHAILNGLPAQAHVVKTAGSTPGGAATLYELTFVLFVDGFETGDTARWSFSTP